MRTEWLCVRHFDRQSKIQPLFQKYYNDPGQGNGVTIACDCIIYFKYQTDQTHFYHRHQVIAKACTHILYIQIYRGFTFQCQFMTPERDVYVYDVLSLAVSARPDIFPWQQQFIYFGVANSVKGFFIWF